MSATISLRSVDQINKTRYWDKHDDKIRCYEKTMQPFTKPRAKQLQEDITDPLLLLKK